MWMLIALFLAVASAIPVEETVSKPPSSSSKCPEEYLRFSQEHSGCKIKPNPRCTLYASGLNGQKEIDEILKAHNTFRSQVATGQEKRAGGMPKASNMMQMVWDPELAVVAQRWADNCVYDHDCNLCREVDNFKVGQNMARGDTSCSGAQCEKSPFSEIVKSWYDEVADYDRRNVGNFQQSKGKAIGHFTQVVWAETWRVGCGFSSFKQGGGTRHMYVCNYGPTGNMRGEPVYKEGAPCSGCPVNSECQAGGGTYPGLCKMLDSNVAPEYPQTLEGAVFHCNFSQDNPDCDSMASGVNNWVMKDTLSGSVLSIKLKGGQQSQIDLKTAAHPKKNPCIRVQYRKGPAVDGHTNANKLEMIVHHSPTASITKELRPYDTSYTIYGLNFFQVPMIRVSFKFSVPSEMPDQIVDIKNVWVLEGSCP